MIPEGLVIGLGILITVLLLVEICMVQATLECKYDN